MTVSYRRLLVPTDFSAQSEQAWMAARALARCLGAEVVLVHVVVEAPLFGESPWNMGRVAEVYESGRQWAEKSLEEWASAARAEGLTVRTVLRTGAPHREIVALAGDEHADMIVIGTHGRGGVDRALLGSVTDRVVRLAPCPVLTVRA